MTRTAQMVKPRQAAPSPGDLSFDWNDPAQRTPLILLGLVTVLVTAAYWNMLSLTASHWSEALYSHGWLIPAFALVLLYLRKQPFRPVPMLDRWVGLAVLVGGLAMRIVGSMYYSNPVDRLSFLVVLLGAFLMVGGWHVVRWAGPAIGFLIFMYPLPSVLERNILLNLQKLATIASTFIFQMLGFTAIRHGNRISMEQVHGGALDVAAACSGLNMTTIFIGLSVAIVLLVERPWWDKFMILASSIPIALFVNVIRVTITGLLFMTPLAESEKTRNLIAHDLPGYIMPIMAMGLMWLELWVLSRLMVVDDARQVVAMGMRGRAPVPH